MTDEFNALVAKRASTGGLLGGAQETLDSAPTDNGPPSSVVSEAYSWQQVMTRRSSQCVSDWQTADSIRKHIQILLDRALSLWTREDGQIEQITTLAAHELRQLALALGDVQRVQRMALGLSSDEVGLIPQNENHVAPPKTRDSEQPKSMFIVELSRSGRFVQARPRRVI